MFCCPEKLIYMIRYTARHKRFTCEFCVFFLRFLLNRIEMSCQCRVIAVVCSVLSEYILSDINIAETNMRQPELGRKINELRTNKGMTQEDLADRTGVSVRSIQRIESGQTAPRISTLNLLSDVLEFEFEPADRGELIPYLLLMHLSSIIPLVIVPMAIWLSKRDEFPEIEDQGKRVVNFQISMMIYLFAAAQLAIILIGIPILIGLGIYCFGISLINTMKSANGQEFHYPMTINFLK